MKCKIFTGTWYEAQDAFNAWAKGKALSREVLIHTVAIRNDNIYQDGRIVIVVYHPEDPSWDKTEPTLTAPMYLKPEPHIKEKEIVITQ